MDKRNIFAVMVMFAVPVLLAGSAHSFKPEKTAPGSKVDLEVAKDKNKWVKKGADIKQEYDLTVTTINLGSKDSELSIEDISDETPGVIWSVPNNYTVDKDGNYYIADRPTYDNNGTYVPLKVFDKNGQLLRIITLIHPHIRGSSMITELDSVGNIYGYGGPEPFVVKYDKDGKVLKSYINESGTEPGKMDRIGAQPHFKLFPSGKFEVEDIVTDDKGHDDRFQLFDPNGQLITENRQSFCDDNLFYHEDYQGRVYRIVRVGGKQIQVQRLINDKVDLNLNLLQDKQQEGWNVLGFDKAGFMYILREYVPEGQPMGNVITLVERFNPNSGTIDYLEIPKRNMLTGAGTNRFVRVDEKGNIYQMQITLENFKILKWSKKDFK